MSQTKEYITKRTLGQYAPRVNREKNEKNEINTTVMVLRLSNCFIVHSVIKKIPMEVSLSIRGIITQVNIHTTHD